jgi:flagellar protein FlaI
MANKTIEKVKSLRGALYRKLKEKEKSKEAEEFKEPSEGRGGEEPKKSDMPKGHKGKPSWEAALPGFQIKKSTRIVEFPKKIDDVTKINIIYPLIEPFVYAHIRPSPYSKELIYTVLEPEMTDAEKDIMKKVSEALIEVVEVELSAVTDEGKAMEYLEKQIKKVMSDFGIKLSADQYVKIMYYIYRNFIGFNEIEPFLQDPHIEDISCDGVGAPIYIVHRKFGSLKTNIMFRDDEYLREFIIKLAERCGRYVSYAEPILAATLPDGSRVSATLAGDVATRGPTFTIRKFGENPMSPVDQMKMLTASSDMLAYFWYIIENGASMLIVGGVATGKTSFLNSLCMFIPPESKIVSIEDTRELRIPNEHWVPSLARTGFGIPMPSGEKYGGVTLFDLLKESFRQNPDYVVVGETRGKEAYVLFQGMSSGHPSMSTFHAGSVDTVIKRLITPPIELSPTLIESLNVVAVMIHARNKGKSARRIREIVEIGKVDPKTNQVDTRVIFKWNPVSDTYERLEDSMFLKKIVTAKGGTLEKAYEEIEKRKQLLDWMYQNDINDYKEVTNLIGKYYKESDKMIKDIGGVVKVKKGMRARASRVRAKTKRIPLERPVGAEPAVSGERPVAAVPPRAAKQKYPTETVPQAGQVSQQIPVGKETVIRIEVGQARDNREPEYESEPELETEREQYERPLEDIVNELKSRPKRPRAKAKAATRREQSRSEEDEAKAERRERIRSMLRKDKESVNDLFKSKLVREFR